VSPRLYLAATLQSAWCWYAQNNRGEGAGRGRADNRDRHGRPKGRARRQLCARRRLHRSTGPCRCACLQTSAVAGAYPLFVFNQFGDLERCALRAGNVHSADGWDNVLKPVVARYQGKLSRIYFRADAAFAMPEVYSSSILGCPETLRRDTQCRATKYGASTRRRRVCGRRSLGLSIYTWSADSTISGRSLLFLPRRRRLELQYTCRIL
jgi:hypothetical protein